jgi:hypothetical protein
VRHDVDGQANPHGLLSDDATEFWGILIRVKTRWMRAAALA